jgi:hypothetical protein
MADQWVELKADEEGDKGKSLYANLAHAISIWPNGTGSRIWYHPAAREEKWYYDVSPTRFSKSVMNLAMPTGPKGEKRPADVIGNAVKVMRIATGEIEDAVRDPAKELHRKGGLKGGKARAAGMTPERRAEIAKRAAAKRWEER